MISGIGETPEFRRNTWNNATDSQRIKFKREMEEWEKKYPFCAQIMLGNMTETEQLNFFQKLQ